MAENIRDREARFRSVSPLILEVENVLLCPGRRELRRRRDGLPRLLPRLDGPEGAVRRGGRRGDPLLSVRAVPGNARRASV